MSVLPVGFGSSGGYQIDNSLRFRASAGANLSRTFGANGRAGEVVEFSLWVKRGGLGTQQNIISVDSGVAWYSSQLEFTAANQLRLFTYYGLSTTRYGWITTRVFRDPSAWLHIKISIDTAQSGQASRRLWINGVEETSFTAEVNGYNTASMATYFLGPYNHAISASGGTIFDGYLAEFYALDNTVTSDATSFGETNSAGVWVPKAYTGTYGTNGFYLPFDDATSTTTLGYDRSGNGNNWTCNNISLTAGVTYDHMVDTPTNNYATLNPLISNFGGFMAFATEANLSLVITSGSNLYTGNHGTPIPTTGKWYWECNMGVKDGGAGQWYQLGVLASNLNLASGNSDMGLYNGGWCYYNNGDKGSNGSYAAYGATFTDGDVIGVAYDADAATLTFYKNNTSQGLAFSSVYASVPLVPAFQFYRSTSTSQSMFPNFGQRPFTYDPPTGFKALCTANLPEVAITTSGNFAGNASADGPFVWLNGNPTAMMINGNAVTFGTHADKTAGGFKVRSSSASYNTSGSNSYSITTAGKKFRLPNTAQGNP